MRAATRKLSGKEVGQVDKTVKGVFPV